MSSKIWRKSLSPDTDLSKVDTDYPRSTIAYCALGDFPSALESAVASSTGGVDVPLFFWAQYTEFLMFTALWEMDNFVRGGGALDNRQLKSVKKVHSVRVKRLAKLVTVDWLTAFVKLMTTFSEYGPWEKCESALLDAQETEFAVLRKAAKFYGLIAKLAYREREIRGIGKAVGGGAKVGAMNGGGLSETVVLSGEDQAEMLNVLEEFGAIKCTLFGCLTEKKVAIDNGVCVVFKWGLEEQVESS
jgi:hypothetical protein